MRVVLRQLFGLIQEAHERRPLLNNELSQKLAHGEVGLSLPGFMISIKQSAPTLKPRYPHSSTASPQPIHNLSVSPHAPLEKKRGGGGQRDVHLSGVHTRECRSFVTCPAMLRSVVPRIENLEKFATANRFSSSLGSVYVTVGEPYLDRKYCAKTRKSPSLAG